MIKENEPILRMGRAISGLPVSLMGIAGKEGGQLDKAAPSSQNV